MDPWKKRWGFEQWAAYFESQTLPVMPESKLRLLSLEAEKGDALSVRELVGIVLADPLLCLFLLREVERHHRQRLDHETTTALAAIMQLGVDRFRKLLIAMPEVDTRNPGLMAVEARASLAARIALHWAAGHQDLNPEEVAVSALLLDTGELLLWVYAAELAMAAHDELLAGRAQRSSQAQLQVCGFDFRSLTIRCSELWHLPAPMRQLLRGSETVRAQLTRISTNAARHVIDCSETSSQAIAADIAQLHELIPGAGIDWMLAGLGDAIVDRRAAIIAELDAIGIA